LGRQILMMKFFVRKISKNKKESRGRSPLVRFGAKLQDVRIETR
jgi:hypothetical protein